MSINGNSGLFWDLDSHVCDDDRPSVYLKQLRDPAFEREFPFTMLSRLKKVGQSPRYHPEGSVWNHTLLVVDEAARRKGEAGDGRAFMWAALLHDIGKAATTRIRKGKITAYDHDKAGAEMSREFLSVFEREPFVTKVSSLVRWHMQILYAAKSMRFTDLEAMRREAEVNDIALLGLCDRLGRLGANRSEEEQNITAFLKKVNENERV